MSNAFVFDMDGVLIDNESNWTRLEQEMIFPEWG